MSGQSTRDRILQAAVKCFAEDGYRRARMVNVAAHAGVSRAGLYRHFPTKELLLIGVYESLTDLWLGISEQVLREEVPPAEAIATWLREGLALETRFDGFGVLVAEAARLDRQLTLRAFTEMTKMVARVLRRGVERGEFASDLDVDATAAALQTTMIAMRRLLATSRLNLEVRSGGAVTDALVAMVLRGLKS